MDPIVKTKRSEKMPKLIKRLPKSQNVVVWVDGISFFATVAQIRVGISPSPTTSMAVRDVLESLERSRAAGKFIVGAGGNGYTLNDTVFPAVSISLEV
jgi:hypothetical protein